MPYMAAVSAAPALMYTPNPDNAGLPPDEPPAQHIARRLIDRERSGRAGDDSAARTAATACDHVYRDLSRWLGHDGCHALFVRALAQARPEYPALEHIHLRRGSTPYIDGVAEAILTRGEVATAEGLEWILVGLIELLGRLIGDDMAATLIQRSLVPSDRRDTTSDNRRGEEP